MSSHPHDSRTASAEELIRFLENVPYQSKPDGGSPIAPSPGCPPAHLYMGVALGTCDRAKGQELLDHAVTCGACAQTLATSLRSLEQESSREETGVLEALPAAEPSYQEALSRKLAATPARKRPILLSVLSTRNLWTGAAAALLALAAFGIFLWQRHADAPATLLAKAYEESRTLELRIPAAAFAPLKPGAHTRGDAAGTAPAALFEARAKLTRALQQKPQDERTLQLSARAALLEEHYDEAIDILDRLIASGPVTAELLTDAATAYYQRGIVSGRELDRATALDYLRRADELAPTDPVVLFNEAVVMQDRGQLMNAVEVWNRYSAVERDPHWAAEGKRKLAELETTLDRLKSHQSRLLHMLATSAAMQALARDAGKLAVWDEELSSVELDKLLNLAFPETPAGERARGSPCPATCIAARTLLDATAQSLKKHHNDDWLADLFPPDIQALSSENQAIYTHAMRSLAQASREDQTGLPDHGQSLATQAKEGFLTFAKSSGQNPALLRAAFSGEQRARLEYLIALQKGAANYAACRTTANEDAARLTAAQHAYVRSHYPWITALLESTLKICSDTPETRAAGYAKDEDALHLAIASHYTLLTARIELHRCNDFQMVGDQERALEAIQGPLREMLARDAPAIRIVNSEAVLSYIEFPSSRFASAKLQYQEIIHWCQLVQDARCEIVDRQYLAILEIRTGALRDAQLEIAKADALQKQNWPNEPDKGMGAELATQMAEALLEQGASSEAGTLLARTNPSQQGDTDSWLITLYAGAVGQVELEQHHLQKAEDVLEREIAQREGHNHPQDVDVSDQEFAKQDHDLYGELAAAWLEDGRPVEDVLALWERFRLRSQGLPVRLCADRHLNCERDSVIASVHQIGNHLLTGEIVLMDRVLVYQMDAHGIRWQTRRHARQDILDAAQNLERAISSPATSEATAQLLGKHLADALLPTLPSPKSTSGTVYLEPDPLLGNLAWPVLPTGQGPLGLGFAVAEISSILAKPSSAPGLAEEASASESSMHPLIIGASVSTSSEPPLPEAIEEARAVGAFLNAPTLLLGTQANTQNVARKLPDATLLHFAGHALSGKEGPRLLLAQNTPAQHTASVGTPGTANPALPGNTSSKSWIDASFLRAHPPRYCRLAVLSACSTGEYATSSVDPLQDLVATLSSLGIPQVVATRWQIDSEASLLFMRAFYASLKSTNDVPHALQGARKVQLSNSSYNNPYYWAAYYVTGREPLHSTGESYARNPAERQIF